ncbi:ABC transporter permease subunit [Nonomuraea spiralis]|uniref:ABC transporter permease subunit n=1 Tax=Nonomuraea spiralis TaxID=46182 RepID=A0ABV5ICJ2_9ACTN|nr:ABC transporter permease subunit [Nonomuraea spiralis]GGS77820.1 ABC transporter permease [Nonomuraea spiralis]
MTDILRSEWTKIRSVRSTVWTLTITFLLMVGLGGAISAASKATADGQPIPGDDAVMTSLTGMMLASLSIATLGVLVISSEYRTGGIRTSLMAVPRRMSLLAGKIVVFTVTALVVCTVAAAAAVAVGLAILRPASVDMGAAVQSVLGAGLYLTVCGLFGLGLGTLVRHTPGALVSAIALMLVLPQLTGVLPGQWGKTIADHFTTNAGMEVVLDQPGNPLGPWSGLGVYALWVAVAVVAGAVLMQRRDA